MNTDDNGELPEGWATAPLSVLVKPSSEKVEPKEQPDAVYLSLEHIEPHTSEIIGRGRGSDVNSTKAVFRSGDVLYGKLRPYLNKVAVPDFDGICSTDILVFRQQPLLDSRFLRRFLSTPTVVQFANHNSTGVQLPRIGFEALGTVEFPLPPLAEQRRIVAAVEAVLAKVNAARDRLNRVPSILKRFRQAVLSAACSGRLTADWRDKQGTSDDENPANWTRANLGALLTEKPQNGVYKPQSDYGSGTLILRIDNFYDGVIEPWANLKRLKLSANEVALYGLADDDVVVNRVNSFKFLGKCGLVRGLTEACVFESNMMRLQVDASQLRPDFAVLFLCSPEGRDLLRANAKHAVNQASINQGDVQAVELLLPPLPEQQEIVRRVGELFALADRIEARLADTRQMADQLTQAVLAKAFRGELVPTEAELARREKRSYEPAADLLARIRADRENATPPANGKPTRKPRRSPNSEVQ